MSKHFLPEIDVVIIGVNSEATLERCIASVRRSRYPQEKLHVIYVDGGSSDRSVDIALHLDDVLVVEARPEHPSPGFQRNRGWEAGGSEFVMFLDSDTILDSEWLREGINHCPCGTGAVRGWRREMYPEQTVYNWIADQEWNAPTGKCANFGGDVLVRRAALEETGGYDEQLVGGEEPELSQRIRHLGWTIEQIAHPMTEHDIAMRSVHQYWKRAFRTGYGYAAVASRYWHKTDEFWLKELVRICIRGGAAVAGVPAFLGLLLAGWSLIACGVLAGCAGLLFYPRIFSLRGFRKMGFNEEEARIYAWHCSFVVVPEFLGMVRYFMGAVLGCPLRNRRLILRTATTL